jgi:small basic protein
LVSLGLKMALVPLLAIGDKVCLFISLRNVYLGVYLGLKAKLDSTFRIGFCIYNSEALALYLYPNNL